MIIIINDYWEPNKDHVTLKTGTCSFSITGVNYIVKYFLSIFHIKNEAFLIVIFHNITSKYYSITSKHSLVEHRDVFKVMKKHYLALNINWCTVYCIQYFKGIVHHKIKIVYIYMHCHVIPSIYEMFGWMFVLLLLKQWTWNEWGCDLWCNI